MSTGAEGMLFFPTASSVLRRGDYDSLEGELRRTDGCSHVMPGFPLVSNTGDAWRSVNKPCLIVKLVDVGSVTSRNRNVICWT